MNTEMNRIMNADPYGRITLQGHDAVAFHAGEAIKGEPTITAEYHGYRYWFTSETNKAEFEKNPERYLPAYGGYCSYGVSLDVLAPVDISTWEIIDGRLHLHFSEVTKQKFAEGGEEGVLSASENWVRVHDVQRQALAG